MRTNPISLASFYCFDGDFLDKMGTIPRIELLLKNEGFEFSYSSRTGSLMRHPLSGKHFKEKGEITAP